MRLNCLWNRISIVPPFSGLRRFPEGRGFKQWTGDDSKALMKVGHNVSPLIFIIKAMLGLSPRAARSSSNRRYSHVPCIFGILLHSTEELFDRSGLNWFNRCPRSISWISKGLWDIGCTSWWNFATKATRTCPLSCSHPTFWGSEWTVFINHRIQTYTGSEGAMATVEPESATRSNVGYKPTPWPTGRRPN